MDAGSFYPLIPAKAGTQSFGCAYLNGQVRPPVLRTETAKDLGPGFRRDERKNYTASASPSAFNVVAMEASCSAR